MTVVSLPDANPPVDVRLKMLASDGGEAFAYFDAVAGPDGGVHILFMGFALRDESIGLAVYVHISPNGELIRTETLPDPSGELDPGDVANLAVDPVSGPPTSQTSGGTVSGCGHWNDGESTSVALLASAAALYLTRESSGLRGVAVTTTTTLITHNR